LSPLVGEFLFAANRELSRNRWGSGSGLPSTRLYGIRSCDHDVVSILIDEAEVAGRQNEMHVLAGAGFDANPREGTKSTQGAPGSDGNVM